MISKRGVLITIGIAVAVVGSSFIVWIIPQGGNNSASGPYAYQDVYSSVYTKNNDIATKVQAAYQGWLSNRTTGSEALITINQSLTQTQQLLTELSQAQPPQEWQAAFTEYRAALGSFTNYLNSMQNTIDSGNKTSNQSLETARQDWLQHVNKSVNSIPIS